MIRINPSRVRPQKRLQTPSDKTPAMLTETYIAPVGGWVSNQPLAAQGAHTAVVLENFWPTATGIEPRGGSKLRCSIAGPVRSLFEYRAGFADTYFAADDTAIYEFSSATLDGTALSASVSGQSSGDYSTLEMQTDGGSFLSVVNGRDLLQIYDGSTWQQVTGASTPFAITGIDTDRISHIWAYRNRQFMVEGGTMHAWYLGVNSVAGAAAKLPLAGLFKKGGALLFGATWSSDSGDGMDDRCVFATDQGEFAVFQGADPGNVNDWGLVGVFDLGEPLGRRAVLTVGGDLIVATRAGLIPISAAVSKDPSQLKLAALSRDIDPDWRHEIVLAGNLDGWRLEKWESRNMAVFSPPPREAEQGYCYAVNLETNAWTKFTGWRIGDLRVLGRALHYGDESGAIFLCDIGGNDNGEAFQCRACLAFDHLGGFGTFKTAQAAQSTWRYRTPINPAISIAADYRTSFPAAPNSAQFTDGAQASWDTATWDVDQWAEGTEAYQILKKRHTVSGHGETLAVQVQLTSAAPQKLDCELVSVVLAYTGGEVFA
ncbi:hypothetical protein [Leisingera sp. NJS204]|uniref:hypothetical protein n=1 Tax=Leisingera sp. NJS204 TaxID=2508307 RepID=UPI0010130564|nr:hypothetical protein [Leisingera sp. NJS204]QAX31313.1 hypothetical protein ETW24_19085 [Leisingera sp. NJS204]